ncbi:MAG TPA: SDR family NAD(P)-dependent oxidoreductase, partial [Acidimicrobiia bacterium]|nr:SDR family NAD(P)-dependent oxidoreductase [Acidimicrobiia bacterium]
MRGLDGKVAIVTGAASGLGEATCARLREEGAVVVGFDLTTSTSEARAADVRPVDVTDEVAVAAATDAVVAEHGRVDILATFAGVAGGGPVHDLDASEWARVIAVNLTGTYLSTKHALR